MKLPTIGKLKFSPLLVLVLTLVIVVLISGVALAAGLFEKDLSTNGTIVSDSPDLGFFEDSTCTTVLTDIQWGDVYNGESTTVTVYIKNIGNRDFTDVTMTDNLDANYGHIGYSQNSFAMSTGGAVGIDFTLDADGTLAGSITPTIHFACTY